MTSLSVLPGLVYPHSSQSHLTNTLTPQQLPIVTYNRPGLDTGDSDWRVDLQSSIEPLQQAAANPHLRTGDSDVSLRLQARTSIPHDTIPIDSPRYAPSMDSDRFTKTRTILQTGDSDVSLRLQARTSIPHDNPPPKIRQAAQELRHNMLTYTEYYQSTPSPLGVGPARDLAYQTIYDYFAEETATPVLLGRLLDLFEPEAVGALGIFLTNTFGKARLRLVQGLRKYPGPLTAPSTNKGKAFGYLDDIEGDAGELVLVDAALLEQAPETLVLSLDRHLDVIKHAHHSHMIPMVLGDDPHMEVITPFKACFIPFQLVPLLLGKGLSPVHALNIIYPYLDTLNLALTCAPLLNTLRAAGTGPTIVDGGPGLTLYMRNQVLYRDLPGLKQPSHPGQQPAPGLPAGVDPTLAATITALTNQQLKLSEGLDQRRPPATVKNTWGPLYTQRLLLLCGKLEEANLPPIYQAWAQKGKHEKTHMIFQSQVATCAAEFLIQAPLVTTAALKKFQDGNFHGTDPFDVADGILPLAFTPPGGSAASLKREQEAAATVAAYDTMISTEGNSLTLKTSWSSRIM
eukprot:jgi/Psemu1/60542/gm1.60542_g